MTRTTNARLAGFAFLFYIAVALSGMMLFGKASAGVDVAAKLANIAEHATEARVAVLLTLLSSFCALVLGVTLYGITREEDHELAMLAMACRVCEGLIGALSLDTSLGLLWLATARTGPRVPDAATANVIGAFLFMPGAAIGASFFAVGSTIFAYLLLRGRMVPVPLAGLGVLASVLLVVTLPPQLAGFFQGGMTVYLIMWMPMLVFEVTLAVWLLVKGAAAGRPAVEHDRA
jgi:hypothetical protein